MVQQWHPDLYKPGSLMQQTAEDITKEANEAYGQLYRKKLYRQYPPREERGEEPAAAPATPEPAAAPPQAPAPKPAPRSPGRPGRRAPPSRGAEASWGYAHWEERLVRGLRGRRTKVVLGAVLALAAIPLCWALWESVPASVTTPRPASAEVRTASGGAERPAAASPAAPPDAPNASAPAAAEPDTASDVPSVAPDPDLPYRRFTTGPSLRALVASTQSLLLPEVGIPAAEADPLAGSAALISELFEMGDTKAKVLSVEGPPDEAGDTVYRYGSSLVYFRAGRVRGWVDRLPRLRVRSWAAPTAPSIERFSLGSPRGEVVRAEGAPGVFTADTYLFGSSAVFFANGRVSGWSEGGVPLHVLQLPQLPFRDPEPARRP